MAIFSLMELYFEILYSFSEIFFENTIFHVVVLYTKKMSRFKKLTKNIDTPRALYSVDPRDQISVGYTYDGKNTTTNTALARIVYVVVV